MRIRSVKIKDFRKFVGTHVVEGMTDGVNVLVGRNELGKSTLMAAINGVIFEKAKSTTETVRGFRHSVRGNVPEIELTFELDDKQWTIRKRFAYQSGKAVLTNSDSLRFEDEAAELQLQKLFEIESRRGGSEPGIWGTLWVSQGKSFGDPALNDAGRSSLQGCIETQVGVVTGGKRGRKLPLAVDEALRKIMSAKGPSGEYKDAIAQLQEVGARGDQLEEKRNEIFKHMDSLSRQKRERKSLEADWNDDDHRRELDETRSLRTAAAVKAHVIEAAQKEATNTDERATRKRLEVEDRAKRVKIVESIEANIHSLNAETEKARIVVEETRANVDAGEMELATLRERQRVHGEETRRFERLRNTSALQAEIERHKATLEKAASLQLESGRLSELIGQISATDDSLSRIEAAETSLAGAEAALNAVATTLTLEVRTNALDRVRLDDSPLASAIISRAVVAKTQIDIEGIGKISIEPQIRDRDAMLIGLHDAEDELKSALEAVGVKDLSSARLAVAQRHELERRLAEIRREVADLAPKEASTKLAAGLEARQTRVRELQGRLKSEFESLGISELPTIEDAQRKISEGHISAEKLDAEISVAEAAAAVPKAILINATATLQGCEHLLAGLRGSLERELAALTAGRSQYRDEDLSAHATELKRLADEAQTALKASRTSQGETVAAIDARIKRLETAGKNHNEELNRLNNEITRLTALIQANEGTGVEEAFEIARANQSRLEAAVKGYEEEVRVLQLLQQTLREAESEANTLYLAPVLSLVEPYLKMLLPGADLVLDENLGISAVKRNGTDEAFERLSDGTQEQLAILTRLAFAELLLTKGQPATVILDDALAFSDDDRIERMFDILMRAGDNVQILVLTCRKKLFSRLGATELRLREIEA